MASIHKRAGRRYFSVAFRDWDGKQCYKSTKLSDPILAQAMADEITDKLASFKIRKKALKSLGQLKPSLLKESVEQPMPLPDIHFLKPPKPVSAVYFLIHEGRVKYVGQTSNIFARAITHCVNRARFRFYVLFIKTPARMRMRIERHAIATFQPEWNTQKVAETQGWPALKALIQSYLKENHATHKFARRWI